MNTAIIHTTQRKDGREVHSILPIESPAAFEDLVCFVRGDFSMIEVDRIEGPGSIVSVLESGDGRLVLVLNDMMGAELSGQSDADEEFAQRVVRGIEERIREVQS